MGAPYQEVREPGSWARLEHEAHERGTKLTKHETTKGVVLVDQPPYAQGLLAKVDQEAEVVPTLLEIEQALLDVFGQDGRVSLGFQDEVSCAICNQEIDAAFRDDHAL
jgi:hypothetical protein